jgi:hypothetical protein
MQHKGGIFCLVALIFRFIYKPGWGNSGERRLPLLTGYIKRQKKFKKSRGVCSTEGKTSRDEEGDGTI